MTDDQMVTAAVAAYAREHTTPPSAEMEAVADETRERMPAPQMMSGRVESRLLEGLVVATRARRVLEVGTFTGEGALAMAAALPEDGRLVTIEYEADHADVARRHIGASSHGAKIELLVGDARELLQTVDGPFDVIFLDAWKRDYADYYEQLLPKLSTHGVLVADNVLWHGRVVGDQPADEDTSGLRAFNTRVREDARVHNALLTVEDGLLLVWRAPGILDADPV